MFSQKRGQAAILITMCLIGILSLLAVVVDTGRIYVEHTKLQKAVDSAVLAAAQELPPGKKLEKGEIEKIVYQALVYNLRTEEITVSKNDNVNDYLLPSDAIHGTVEITKGEEYTTVQDIIDSGIVDIQFLVPADTIEAQETVISVTVHKLIETRLSTILGYDEWTISAQRIARNGPIGSIPEFVPIAVITKVDMNNRPLKIPYRETIRLSNTTHNISDITPLYTYVPFSSYSGITGSNAAIFNMFKNSIDHATIKTSKTANIQETRINNREESKKIFSEMCKGIEERIRSGSAGKNTVGCINSDDVILEGSKPYNITSINGSIRFSYGDDPRLILIPIVQTTMGTYNTLGTRQRSFKVIGFGMFYIQYAHYTSYPPGGEHFSNTQGDTVAMTELVGYFTDSVIEGPINPQSYDYGLTGVEFVDPNDEDIFDIHN